MGGMVYLTLDYRCKQSICVLVTINDMYYVYNAIIFITFLMPLYLLCLCRGAVSKN